MAPAGGSSQKAADLQIDDRGRLACQIEIAVSRTNSNLSRMKSQRNQTTYKVKVGGTTAPSPRRHSASILYHRVRKSDLRRDNALN